MSHPNFVRIVETTSGPTVDTPRGLENFSGPIVKAAWSSDLPPGAQYEILSWAEYVEIVGTDIYGPISLYRDVNGDLASDPTWENRLMPPWLILNKHKSRLLSEMKVELAAVNPDTVKLARVTYGLLSLSALSEKEIYEIALDSLEFAEIDKPEIAQKLADKIAELEAEEV